MEVKCIRLDDMGRGICKIDGKTTFVNDFLPDEIAEIKIILNKKSYNEGEIIKLIKPSKDRIKPKCPYLKCGCQLKHLDYGKEILYKEKKLKEILFKFGKIEPKINKMIYDNNFHYRNKITLKVKNKVGFFENKTNNFIEIKKCELVSEKVNKIISLLNKEDLSEVKEITIKEFDGIMLIIDGQMKIRNIEKYADTIFINDKLVKGNPFIKTNLKDLIFNISKDSFFQVNKTMTEKLYDIAIKYLGKGDTVLDLYCGTGTISLILSKYFKKVIGVDLNKEAIKCANLNKELNKISNVEFICGDVSKEIKKLKADKIIVDPPRKGITKEGVDDILKLKPKILVYISCNPITLARDLNLLKDNYNIIEVTPVNMFPRTYHLESVVKLEKK